MFCYYLTAHRVAIFLTITTEKSGCEPDSGKKAADQEDLRLVSGFNRPAQCPLRRTGFKRFRFLLLGNRTCFFKHKLFAVRIGQNQFFAIKFISLNRGKILQILSFRLH